MDTTTTTSEETRRASSVSTVSTVSTEPTLPSTSLASVLSGTSSTLLEFSLNLSFLLTVRPAGQTDTTQILKIFASKFIKFFVTQWLLTWLVNHVYEFFHTYIL